MNQQIEQKEHIGFALHTKMVKAVKKKRVQFVRVFAQTLTFKKGRLLYEKKSRIVLRAEK